MCKTYFSIVSEMCCHGNSILGGKKGTNLMSRTPPSVFDQFSWNFAQMFICRYINVQDTYFISGKKCVTMVTTYYGWLHSVTAWARVLITSSDIFSLFSSPEPKARWAIAIAFRPSSVVRRASSVVRRASSVVRKLFTFSSSSPEPVGRFQPNLVGIICRG